MSERLKLQLETDEIHARLVNWGRWLRWDSAIARLGYPTEAPFSFSPRRGGIVADLDAEHIEWVISSLNVSGYENGVLYAFILKVEYAESPDQAMSYVGQRAEDVRQRFKRPCAISTYYYHLVKAKTAVRYLAGPIK